jgi:hypothetical protein
MATVKLWGRIQPKQASQKFYRCGIGFGREWPEEPIEVDKATAERLKQEQMLEVTDIDPNVVALPVDQASGAVVTAEFGAAGVKVAPEDQAERIAAIRAAIVQLDASTASLWTAGGSPKTEALAAITGWPVSTADRDAAFALVVAESANQ